MPSIPASAFRDAVIAGLSEDQAELVDNARGGGSEYREMHRALMLGDRAAREWAASALAAARAGGQNRLEALEQLGKPEDAYTDLQPAARAEQKAAGSDEESTLADAVVELAEVLPELDTEATVEGNRAAFEAVGRAAAEVLLRAGDILGGEDFVVAQANRTLGHLVDVSGWTNQLGPRFGPAPTPDPGDTQERPEDDGADD